MEWYFETEHIMENIDLDEIKQKNNELTFVFSENGRYFKTIRCYNVLKYSTDYDYFMSDKMPYFILDVLLKKLSKDDISDGLKYYKYGFNTSKLDTADKGFYFLSIVGSDVSIDVLCGGIEI